MHTANTMRESIGLGVHVQFESILVRCIIRDAKSAYGRIRYQIEPINGLGTQWVEESRINLPSEGDAPKA